LKVVYKVRGEGVPQDFVQAYKWYNLAVAQDNVSAEIIDMATKRKETVRKSKTTYEIAAAQKLSAAWKPVAER
jgi:TPR repeat protein